MTPAEREEALERREANAALLQAKLEKDRVALEADITASASASKAASSIARALQADATKRLKALESDCTQLEAKLARLKTDEGRLTPPPVKKEELSAQEKEAIAAAKAQLANDLATLTAERISFDREVAEGQAKLKTEAKALAVLRAKLANIRTEIESNVKIREAEVQRKTVSLEAEREKLQASADMLARTEAQLSEQRAKMEGQLAALAAKEVMYEERHRQLQENMKNFVRT
jgi:chromosome segregation ATPase